MAKQQDSPACGFHSALMEQIHSDLKDIKADMRDLRAEIKSDQHELWSAMNKLRESITGNSREGLSMRVDRNTRFRRSIVKLLWALFTPLYAGLIALLLKTIFLK